jgi:rod shape-determining protein MreC
MEFLTQFKNALFLIAILVAQAIALAMQVRNPVDPAQPSGPSVSLLRVWAMATVTPLERATHAMGHGVRSGWSDYVDLRNVRQQNKDLQQQLTRMRIAEAAIAEDALAGRRLQAMLGFQEHYVGSTVAAQVIGASGNDQSHILTIDKGSRDGLRADMAVITQDGIVGKVSDVFPTTSQVMEINDQNSGVGVMLATTRIRAILRGTTVGKAQIGNLTSDSRIKPGEQILTSGGDQIYPRGLPVGVIESIAQDPDHQPYTAIRVHPAVNLDQVEEVLVITGTQANLPAAAQQDLDAAEAQSAADASASRLPSIHDNATPGSAADGAATPVVPSAAVVPHPLPALHADRFTSGAAPPASTMTPGAPHSATAAPSSPAASPALSPAAPLSKSTRKAAVPSKQDLKPSPETPRSEAPQ